MPISQTPENVEPDGLMRGRFSVTTASWLPSPRLRKQSRFFPSPDEDQDQGKFTERLDTWCSCCGRIGTRSQAVADGEAWLWPVEFWEGGVCIHAFCCMCSGWGGEELDGDPDI